MPTADGLLLLKPDRPPMISIRSNRRWQLLGEDAADILFAKAPERLKCETTVGGSQALIGG